MVPYVGCKIYKRCRVLKKKFEVQNASPFKEDKKAYRHYEVRTQHGPGPANAFCTVHYNSLRLVVDLYFFFFLV